MTKLIKQEKNYLEVDDQILMNYRYSYGGQSKFFQGVIDKKLFATKCEKCGIVRCPPRIYCSQCYTEMKWVQIAQSGTVVAATTAWFAASTFVGKIPYTMAYIKLDGTDTMICQNIIKKGIVTPGCIRAGERVKAVFKNNRSGKPTDFFFVLEKELDKRLLNKKSLTENEINWLNEEDKKSEKALRGVKVKVKKNLQWSAMTKGSESEINLSEILITLSRTYSLINKSPRAKDVIKNWNLNFEIQIMGTAEKIYVQIKNQKITLVKNLKPIDLKIETTAEAILKNSAGEVDITQYEAKGKVKIIKGELIELIRYSRAILAAYKDKKEKKI